MWLLEIKHAWYIKRLEDVIRFPKKFKNWAVVDIMLYKHTKDEMLDPFYNREEAWRLVLPFELREQALWDAQNEPSSGHLGLEKTYSRLARDFYWPGMYYDVKAYLQQCLECQKYKIVQTGPQGLMTERIIEKPWMVVVAGFVY